MGIPSLENELMQYWPQLNVVQQESILSVIRSIVQPEGRITIEQYNKEIDEAVARVESGEFYTQEEVEKKQKTGDEKNKNSMGQKTNRFFSSGY